MIVKKSERIKNFDKEHYVCPKVAESKWKKAKSENQTLYIYGMCGTGKTSLINYMIGEEDVLYFNGLSLEPQDIKDENLKNNKIIIFDDMSNFSQNPYKEECVGLIEGLIRRDDIWVVISARCDIPVWLMSSYFYSDFMKIEEHDMYFSEDEKYEFYLKWGVNLSDYSDRVLKKINDFLRGNALGEKIFAKMLGNGAEINEETFMKVKAASWEFSWQHVYSEWPGYIFEMVMKLSAVDEFDKELAKMITGESEIEGYLTEIKEMGNFLEVKKVRGENIYYMRYAAIASMRYLINRRLSSEQRTKLYFNIGYYYELKNDFITAMKYYDMAGDMDQMAQVLVKNSKKNPGSGFYFELRKYYMKLPESIVLSNPALINGLCMLESLMLNPERSEMWYDELKKYAELHSGPDRKTAEMYLIILDVTLPHRGIAGMEKVLEEIYGLISNRKINIPEISVTSNLPSQLNGGKDFSEWTKEDDAFKDKTGELVRGVLGKYGKASVNLALAESYFEKGYDNFKVMSQVASGRMQADASNNYEQIFVADGLLAWLYLMMEKPYEAIDVIENYITKIKENPDNINNARKIIANAKAFSVRLGLYVGKIKEANDWLKDEAPDENQEFITYERFKYLTKIRIYIMNGRDEAALSLIQKMLYYAEIMKRSYIKIESLLLLAVVQKNMNDDVWKDTLKECLELAYEYRFTRVITREGAVVKKMLESFKIESYDEDFQIFVKKLRSECRRMADIYPGYMKMLDEKLTLNDNAILILKLQAEGASNAEISEKLGINLNTVKYHNKTTYKKLGVKDKTSAVTEARKRGII